MKLIRPTIYLSAFLMLFAFAHSASAAPVYYSVGQNNSNHCGPTGNGTGCGTITITAGGVAAFSAVQSGNIGVGDRVTYNTNVVAYISTKTDADQMHWTLVTATGGTPADISNSTVVSIHREYTSLQAAIAGASDANHINTADLTSGGGHVLNIPCYYDSGADTAAVTVSGYTTGVSNYIKIYTPYNTSTEANNSQRAQGKWDDSKYVLNVTNDAALKTNSGYIIVEGLQIKVNVNTASFFTYGVGTEGAGAYEIVIRNNIIRGNATADSWNYGIQINNSSINDAKIYNNIVYGFNYNSKGRGISVPYVETALYVYNNTCFGNYYGIVSAYSTVIAKNNIANGNTVDYSGSFDGSSVNNISQDTTSPNSSYQSKSVSFADATNKDFHLAPTDTSAKDAGADLHADANLAFSTDIDGQTRLNNSWDIGADQAATQVYYSVGQNTSDHSSGGNVSITSGVATFTVPQVATNLGVGDVLTVGGNAYYLASKTDTTHWKVVTKLGAVPADLGANSVTGIAHAFNSLSAAISGASGGSYLNSSDLAAGNYQLNIPCYYDTGADTAGVTVTGYTTGASNYIKIYTPSNTATEANNSQRHNGTLNGSSYSLSFSGSWATAIFTQISNVVIDGLAIKMTGDPSAGIVCNDNGSLDSDNVTVKNNLVVDTFSGASTYSRGIESSFSGSTTATQRYFIFNNIVSGFGYGIRHYGPWQGYGSLYVYNNTVVNASQHGIANTSNNSTGTYVYKNNLSYSNAVDLPSGYTNNNNISKDGTASGTNSKANQTVVFVNATGGDFHLAPTDTAAKGAGANLSADSNYAFASDIDGQTRTRWDIGADEAATAVFYSVGQNTSDHSSGGNVSITSGVASFTTAQTATNLGVGDALTAGGNTYYLASKTDTSHWKVITKLGAVPADLGSNSVTGIAHAFASLNSAVSGAYGGSFLNTSDLVAGYFQLNIPCYYDTGADTNYVDGFGSGYITSASNYIKIYTPYNTTTEANQSQRHSGKWNDNKYNLSNAPAYYGLWIDASYTQIDGIQFSTDGTTSDALIGMSGVTNIKISNNILRQVGATGSVRGVYDNSTGTNYFWNNLVYDMTYGSFSPDNGASDWFYNNTIINNGYGFGLGSSSHFKNNIAVGNAGGDFNSQWGNFTGDSDYNISADGTAAGPTHDKANQTVAFADATNKDFHLTMADTAAKYAGVNLAHDANLAFQDDIDGQVRAGDWSIGADQFVGGTVQTPQTNMNANTSGLVGYWSFDGPSINSGQAKDLSGNNNDGTISGATGATGKIGQALGFDAINDEVQAGNSGMNGDTTWTVSGWIKPTAGDNSEGHFFDQSPAQSNVNSGTFHFFCGDDATSASFPYGTWTYVTLVADGSGHHLWINGSNVSSGAQTCAISGGNMFIGRYYGAGDYFFNGNIDEVRVYNRALSSGEIGDLYRSGQMTMNASQTGNSKNGLVGVWSFDGPDVNMSTNTAYDRSGSGNNGTISGATLVMGKVGSALSFDGNTSYINIGSTNLPSGSNARTTSLWFKLNSNVAQEFLGLGVTTNNNRWGMYYNADNKLYLEISNASRSIPWTYDTNWHNFVAIMPSGQTDISSIIICLDGNCPATSGSSGQTVNTSVASGYQVIGGLALNSSGRGDLTSGLLDEVRIYNRALGANEVKDLYNAGQATLRK